MSFMENEDLIAKILKPCFPQADKLHVKQHSVDQLLQYFTSDIIGLTVEFEQDGKQQSKKLVMKAPKRDQTSSYYKELDFYNRETLMYRVMVPHINGYLASPRIPIGYHVTDSDILILENVTAEGYVVRNKYKLFSLMECYPVLEALADFHAASFKVRQQHSHILNDSIFQTLIFIDERMKQNVVKSWSPVLHILLERKNANSLIPKFTAAMQYLKTEDADKIRLKYNQLNFKFNVLNHGDFRINNLLLKYDTNDQLKDVKIIDFQTCVWLSPVVDIMYFFTMSVPVDVVEEHFETLVVWYLQCLNGRLQELNCPDTYTILEFMTDFRNSSTLFILFILVSISILSPLNQEDIEESLFDAKEENAHLLETCLDDKLFVHSSYGWLNFCEKMGGFDAV